MALEFFRPVSNISPFTYRDGETYLEQLKRLRAWIDEVSTVTNAQFQQIFEDFDAGMAKAVADADAAAADAAAAEALAAMMVLAQDTAVSTFIAPGMLTFDALNNVFSKQNRQHPLTGYFHVEGFGAVGDGVVDDTEALQDAIDAAGANGGGIVYLSSKTYKITAGLKIPSRVVLKGQNPGSQSPTLTRINYAGPTTTAMISPADRTVNTINWGFEGICFDGGNVVDYVIEYYRVSYSRMTDCLIVGAKTIGGVGVLYDANVGNQCYFNVADGCKVDGLAVGVRYQNGANVNRWQGGKIGNGGVGMEFLSLSAGNVITGVDFENNSVKHIYVDANQNVFIGLHMEVAPIGFDITSKGNGTRRFGTSFASNVVTYTQTASVLGHQSEDSSLDTAVFQSGAFYQSSRCLTSSTLIQVDPKMVTNVGDLTWQWFRNVSTSGNRRVQWYQANGTANNAFLFDLGKRNLLMGDTIFADAEGVIGLSNRPTAPASDPIGGGIIYSEGGALKYRTSSGSIRNIGGDIVTLNADTVLSNVTTSNVILVTAGAAGVTITLPTAQKGAEYVIKKLDAAAGAVTVAVNGASNIEGTPTKSLPTRWAYIRVVSDGASWVIIGSSGVV